LNTKGQTSIFGVIAFLIVFVILFALVFAPLGNVASDVSVDNVRGTGAPGFLANYFVIILTLCFIIAFGWKIYAG
jgi:uncharacterized RDD family membrane protein YckC